MFRTLLAKIITRIGKREMNAIPKISKLSSRVWRILGCNPGPMTLQGKNIYLVGTGRKRVLIDAGQDGFPEYIQNLMKVLREENVKIEHLVLTHWHHDHVGALPELEPVLKGDAPLVHKFPTVEPQDVPIPSSLKFTPIKDNYVLKTEGATLRIIHTPGHTSDHAVLYLEEEKAVFSGDCILGEGTAVFEDLFEYMKSLNIILQLQPELIYPSHGPVVEDPIEKIQFYIHHRLQREKQILSALETSDVPLTPSEIVRKVYQDTPEHLYPAAEVNVRHHLTKLVKENKIQENDDKFFCSPRWEDLNSQSDD
jgi:glyoxylase-like metal-dependent hydrolase (beta-lactamase superfamily II)